jgi:hypothetical protein
MYYMSAGIPCYLLRFSWFYFGLPSLPHSLQLTLSNYFVRVLYQLDFVILLLL